MSAGWTCHDTRRLKHAVRIRTSSVDKLSAEGGIPVQLCNYVDVYKNDRITSDLSFMPSTATANQITQFALREHDVVITKDSETPDDIAVPALVDQTAEGVVCGYHLAILRPTDIDGRFLFYALQAKPVREQFSIAAKGVTRFGITLHGIGSVLIPFPDRNQQAAVADYLDRQIERLDRIIDCKERMVKLLLEEQSTELDFMTFQSSSAGSWERIPLRWVCRITAGQVDPREDPWSEMPLIAPNHIASCTGRLSNVETAGVQGAISGKYRYAAGTVLYSKIRPALAKACLAPSDGLCSADMYPIIPDERLLSPFLLMQLLSRTFTDWAKAESMRVAMPKLNRATLGSFRLLVPTLVQQEELVRAWNSRKDRYDSLLDTLDASLSTLREQRAAVITAAVCQGLDVSYQSNNPPEVLAA